MLKYFLLWIPMIFIAVINGIARDLWYKRHIGDLTAHQVSTLLLMVFLGIYIFFVTKKYPPLSTKQALWIGLLWFVLTLGFEFGFGRFRGISWTNLLESYNIFNGQLWLLVPIWILISPYLFFKITKA